MLYNKIKNNKQQSFFSTYTIYFASLMMKFLITFVLCAFCLIFEAEAKIKIIDGDSFEINGKEYRLQGVDAPEYMQQCYDEFEQEYRCGEKAYEVLQKIVDYDVKCNVVEKDRYKRYVAVCISRGKDVAEELVKQGWAVAYTQYTDYYVEAEKEAKVLKKGIWQGRFMKPELYRALYQ